MSGDGPEGNDGPPRMQRVITLRYAVAMYISSVLGSGILVVPGLAAAVAGPASILAWILLALASYPFAYTFARLSARRPESGGIYSFALESFGHTASSAVAWLFVAWEVLGAPAATLAAASYLASAFPLSRPEIFAVAIVILSLGFGINYLGIKLSGRVQLATVVSIVGVLFFAVLTSVSRVSASNLTPFFPHGVLSVGVASALIVWCFLGYENVSNVAEEFKDPKRDFHRSVLISVVLVSVLYLAVAFVIVGTGVYRTGSGVTPFANMTEGIFGRSGAAVVSILAVFIIFGTVNAYTAGFGRVAYAAAREGDLPKQLAVLDKKTGTPRRALLALYSLAMVSFVGFYLLSVNIETAFLATSGAAIFAYIIGSLAGMKLLKENGIRRALPVISLVVSVLILPFIGTLLVYSVVIVVLGVLASRLLTRKGPSSNSPQAAAV
ncbi:MAG TPA: amino acid permease [Nitrososphaerales archaeon]|nr:amino acid permease [Nitrososphaerales archaeon]